ncbi:cytochrome b5 isoform X2 [Ptiloglossa arizonensis]|uniref:cytochrome b5 isoform X2 n=1 Tax=Ptiloglossa arizonensis TaxID=3350558 RepID=UPI003FA016D5
MASENTTADAVSPKLYTTEEVSKHVSKNDVWIIINNGVYDLTSFLNTHPGGEEILLEHAGRDGTESFEDIGHSSNARQMMEPLKIGEILEEEKTKETAYESNATSEEDNSSRCCIMM